MSDLLSTVSPRWKVNLTRRNFLRLAAGSSAATVLASYVSPRAHAAAMDFDWKKYKGTTIRYLGWNEGWSVNMRQKLPEFEELTGIKVVWEQLAQDQHRQKAATELTAKNKDLDLIFVAPDVDCVRYLKAGWLLPLDEFLADPKMLPPVWEVLAKPLGMKGTVVVEAGTSWLEDNDWILMLADRYHSIVGFIGNLSGTAIGQGVAVPVWADMTRFRQEVSRLARNPIFRGIRVGGLSISEDLSGGHYPHFEVLADSGLVIDVNGSTAAEIVALAKAVPSLTIVVDHMFGFDPVSASSEKWRSDITVMGDVQNVIMKVSGLVEGLDSPQTDPSNALVQCSGALDHVYQSFGPDRLVFGTNWPVSQPKGEISVVTNIVRSYFGPKGKDVLAKVFAGNARRVYRYVDR